MRKLNLSVVLVAAGFAAAACTDSTTGPAGDLRDKTPPTVTLAKGGTTLDTLIAFQVEVKDNLGIKSIKVNVTGGASFAFDTTLTSPSTNTVVPFSIPVSRSIPVGTPVIVTSYALDGALNKSATDTLHLTVGDVPPAEVRVNSPANGTIAVIGKSIVLSLSGRSAVKVRSLGFRTSGSFESVDSTTFSSPLPDSVSVLDTLTIPANAPTGPLQIAPFVLDSLGQRTIGPITLLNVQPATAINSTPVVSFSLNPRIEVNDTIHIEANDQTGITAFGYEVRGSPGGPIDARDSVTSNGNITSQIKTFDMRLPYTSFPKTVYVQAFARNSNGVRAYAKLPGGADRMDTVVVVAGSTKPLPGGGDVADALYHPATDRLYLTNIQRNQLEVFSLADSSFKSPILVGSRPWGIAAWPRNHGGTMGDTLLVANSGGTDISYVNLNASGSGREVRRYALPNIVVFTVTSKRSNAGFLVQERTRYDFSDRPQFIGTTCTGTGFECGDVVLTYSTTPTPGQTAPFTTNNGTLRWENLAQGTSHFFFEQAMGQAAAASDTLEIIRYDGLTGDATILVPAEQVASSSSKPDWNYSVTVDPVKLAFRDTTFVRNSGNFTRAIYGDGGMAQGSRAMTYDVNRGLATTARMPDNTIATLSHPVVDMGLSQAADVGDFIANAFAKVQGVAMNFDGSLGGIRADSTYLLNLQLRLQGILGTTQSNAGLDFHPLNAGPNSFPLSTRLVFAASAEPVIEIYDSYCYKRVASVPIRDPIIGPIKAAIRPASGQIVLVGTTRGGVVIVTLPDTFTTSCF
ncbi:MAG: YncE family protein [Gemmatimonadaceae bacterium]